MTRIAYDLNTDIYYLPMIKIRDKQQKVRICEERGSGKLEKNRVNIITNKLLIKAEFLSVRHICLQSHQSRCPAENNLMKYLHVFVEEEIWKTLSQFSDG